MDLSETVALVSGGASGLGAASAAAIVPAGGRVVLMDLDADRGTQMATALGDTAQFVKTDVCDAASVSAACALAIEKFGRINAVVNCAGIALAEKTVGREGPHSLEMFRRTVDINLTGSFNTARLGAEAMQANPPDADGQRGVIIHTASIAAFEGQKGQAAYAASKGGVAGMVLPMARDLAGQGIRVMGVAPGLFLTPMLESLPEPAQQALAEQPLFPKRLGHPREFGDLICFILGAPYLNGEVIRLDGGTRLP